MYSRKLALSLAKQYRTCPPEEVRGDADHKKHLEQHRTICPYCSARKMTDPDPWGKLARKLQEIHSLNRSHPKKDQPLIAGQLRPLLLARAGWRDGYFYNPPLVLILEVRGTISDDVLVAQTYHDIYLAGPGDLILTDKKFSSAPFFVESWNTYTLKAEDLDQTLELFPKKIVQAVKVLTKDPGAYPAWTMHPRPLTQNDARIIFRELEMEVGFTYSIQAVKGAVDQPQGPALRLLYSSHAAMQQAIREKVPDIRWPGKQKSFEEVLAFAVFPAERLPLAAAGTEQKLLPANLVLTRDGLVHSFEPFVLETFLEQRFPERREISGRISGYPEGLRGSFLIFLLRIGARKTLSPTKSYWDEDRGSFFVEFRVKSGVEGKMAAAVVCNLTGQPDA